MIQMRLAGTSDEVAMTVKKLSDDDRFTIHRISRQYPPRSRPMRIYFAEVRVYLEIDSNA